MFNIWNIFCNVYLQDETEEQKQAKKQKLVTGTDADLRRLNLKQARLLLKEFGVSQEEVCHKKTSYITCNFILHFDIKAMSVYLSK